MRRLEARQRPALLSFCPRFPHVAAVEPAFRPVCRLCVARKGEILGHQRYKQMRQSSDSCKENLQIVHLCLAKAPKPLDSCLPLLLSTLHVVPGPPVVDQRAACGMARKDHRGSVFANRYVTNKRPFVNECKGIEQAALLAKPLGRLALGALGQPCSARCAISVHVGSARTRSGAQNGLILRIKGPGIFDP
jgi:hypothetical protein